MVGGCERGWTAFVPKILKDVKRLEAHGTLGREANSQPLHAPLLVAVSLQREENLGESIKSGHGGGRVAKIGTHKVWGLVLQYSHAVMV